jgi:uroporphyrinogen decarboxylase
MALTQLECFKATVEHRPHPGFLFYADFTPDLERRLREAHRLDVQSSLRECFGMYVPVSVDLRPPNGATQPDFSAYFADLEIPDGAFVNELGVLEVPANLYHFTGYVSPLRNAERIEEIESFPFQTVAGYSGDHMAAQVRAAHAQGRVASCWVGHMYEDAWQIRDYEQFLMDMILRPEWCELILDRITEKNMAVACAAARAGVDVIATGDDVANQQTMMFGLAMWRRFMKTRWAAVYAAARAIKPDVQIWYHSDGNIAQIIPELIEIGVTILNPVQPECLDPVMVKKKYGAKLVIDGSVGTQSTMPFGSPADVRAIIRERVQTLGDDGALILSPTHILEPEVPLDNIYAFFETVKEYGLVA